MLNELKNATNVSFTTNGARSYATTGSATLDFFAKGGALRSTTDAEKIALFTRAFSEDATLALKALFYFRDIRGGQGERNTFRVIVRYLADYHTESMRKNLGWIPMFGRWDDLYVFVGTRLEKTALDFIASQFRQDIDAEHPSLLGKWLKSENASSLETKRLAKLTRQTLGLTPRAYRKALSGLRERIQIVESRMSANEWNNIAYDKLPSQAGLRYRQAFYRHDEAGYSAFVQSLVRGEKKVNTKALYPYEVIRDLFTGGMAIATGRQYNVETRTLSAVQEDLLNATWANLPDYIGEDADNSLVVADTSGSMRGLPIQIATSLAIYAAERNTGQFNNHFISFSNEPALIELQGTGVCEKVRNVAKTNWGGNTNIEAVFDLILKTAVDGNLAQDEMIDRVFIISDMQFDSATRGGNDRVLFENIKERYARAGYKMPSLVFWNVNAYAGNQPARMTDTGVQLVSGASPSIFTSLLRGRDLTPYQLMLDKLLSDRYSVIEA
jgi:hypothetical protein